MMKGRMKKLLSATLSVLLMLGILTCAEFGGVQASAANCPPYCGLDVSKHNGSINWSTAKARGVDFALLRCYCNRKDECFDQNYAGAVSNGIAVGAYVYMYAENEYEARLEAQSTLNALGGRALDLPLFLDVEYKKVLALGKTRLTDLMIIELEMFRAAGYRPGFYTSRSYLDSYMNPSRLQSYSWWIARWTCEQPKTYTFQNETAYSSKKPASCELWQFSSAGNGSYYGASSTYVDLNFCYVDWADPEKEPEQPTVLDILEQALANILQLCFELFKWSGSFTVTFLSLIMSAATAATAAS